MKARVLGRCVTFNGSYAFLRPLGGEGKDVFAHVSELPDGTLSVGDKVTFDVTADPFKPRRLRATNITLVEDKKLSPPIRLALAPWRRGSGRCCAINKASGVKRTCSLARHRFRGRYWG